MESPEYDPNENVKEKYYNVRFPADGQQQKIPFSQFHSQAKKARRTLT